MKRSAAHLRTNSTDKASSPPSNNAVWLPEQVEDDKSFSWSPAPSSRRLHNATITIAPEEGIEQIQAQRRSALQDIIRRLFIQLRAGCGNHCCSKPLCFTYRSRISRGPVRRPTILTARMQSFVLAEDKNLKERLCPNISCQSYDEILERYSDLIRASEREGCSKKDRKSFTQNLMDTAAVKLFQGTRLRGIPECGLSPSISSSRNGDIPGERSEYDVDRHPRALSQRRCKSEQRSSPYVDQEALGEQIGLSCINSSRDASYGEGAGNGQEYDSSQSNDRCNENTIQETSEECGRSNETPAQITIIEQRSLCQRKLQTHHNLKVLEYLDCELVDNIKQLLSREESGRSIFNHFKTLQINASIPTKETIHPSHPVEAFLRRSVHHCLGRAENLARSFRGPGNPTETPQPIEPMDVTDFRKLSDSLSFLQYMTGSLVYESLWQCLQSLYEPPPGVPSADELRARLQPRTKLENQHEAKSQDADSATYESKHDSSEVKERRYIDDEEAARMLFICLCAFTAAWVCNEQGSCLNNFRRREYGNDNLQDESRRRLFQQMIRVIAARRLHQNFQKSRANLQLQSSAPKWFPLINCLLIQVSEVEIGERVLLRIPIKTSGLHQTHMMSLSSYLAHCLKIEIYEAWDEKVTHKKCSVLSGAIDLLGSLCFLHNSLDLPRDCLYLNLNQYLDPMSAPVDFVNGNWSSKEAHILSSPWLFRKQALIRFFRTINYVSMAKAVDNSELISMLMNRFVIHSSHRTYLNDRLKIALDKFLTINIRRESILEDSFNQLWQRERRELLRPLKVIMGSGQGEEGLDQGGVSLEYFRLAVNEALDPAVAMLMRIQGMFAIDPATNIAWFQPATLEPLYRYELLGLIFSLAVYNGVTLSINFPRVFYRKLVGEKIFLLEDIEDDWPQLAKGLHALLAWDEGDVKDVFMRTYDFSYEAHGQTISMQMKYPFSSIAWRGSRSRSESEGAEPYNDDRTVLKTSAKTMHKEIPSLPQSDTDEAGSTLNEHSSESIYVTNANREQYVRDYIRWLTHDSVEEQYAAFEKGFYTCLNKKALLLLTAENLKDVVEGQKEIDVEALRAMASYEDGYDREHPLIKGFWEIVEGYDEQSRSQLLEFVTASDRIPVNGVQSMSFAIVRNGGDCDRIPSAMTCFGKLLLPEYSSVEKLREKLRIALDNCLGFGSI